MNWVYDYFGRVTSHADLGLTAYTYSYAGNYAGLLASQTSTGGPSGGQNISYSYDAAGHNTQINDTAIGRTVTYAYDAAGRRSREKTVIGGLTYQDTFLTYDVLNRISRSSDLRYDLSYTYDLQGNRTNTVANYYDHERTRQTQDLWYSYDNMNRVLISQGINTFNQIGTSTTQGVKLTYNAAGQRTSSETYGKLKYRHEHTNIWNGTDLPTVDHDFLIDDFTKEDYEYDGLGRLTNTWREAESWVKRTNSSGQVLQNLTTQTRVLISDHEYDKASREIKETTQGIESDDLIQRDRTSVYDDDGQVDIQTSRREDPGMGWQTESIVDYTYDAAGVLRTYKVDVYKTGPLSPGAQYRTTYNNNYRLGESYQDAGQSASSVALVGGAQVPQSGSTTRSYNVNGELISFTDTKSAEKTRKFANGVNGQALLVVQGDITNVTQAFADALSRADNSQKSQWFFFANGQQVGSFGQLQDTGGKFKANFDVNYTAISDEYPSSVPVSVIAQNNDTLRTIAARVFGDQNLWYVLAEENGLSDPDALIEEGTVIQVPNEVLSVSNSSSSFKPFNIGDAIGDTTPTQPMPPPPKKKGCGVLGTILIIIVAIVVTIYTAGALAGGSSALLAGGGTAGSTFAAGTAALTGGLAGGVTATSVGIAAAAGAAGSIASQGAGMAMGMQDSFSWKNVALAAVGAGVTAGLGGSTAIGGAIDKLPTYTQAAASGALGSALTQGIAVSTGLQSSFSWREVAISGVAAAAAQQAGGLAARTPVIGEFAGRFASGVAGSYVRRAFGGKMDTATILADAFGNALGNSIVDTMQTSAAERRQREIDESKARIREGMLASTNGAGGSGSDPLDLVRSDPAFQSVLGKLGKDATVLYDTEIWSLLQHAEDGTSMTANFGSGRVALSAAETQQLAAFLSLSGAVTYGDDRAVDSSMALVARSGASLDDVNATVRGALGKFVTDWDLSDLTSGVHVSNGVIDRSVALSLMPLQDAVLERFNISVYGNPRSIAAYEAYEQASNELINPYRESTTTYKQQALNNYQRITGSIRSDLVSNGYLPARIAFSERATSIYEGIGSLMLGAIPAERLAAPILKGVLGAVRGIAPFVRAESTTGRVLAQYQRFYDEEFAAATQAYQQGRLRPGLSPQLAIGNRVDMAATQRLKAWLENEGLSNEVLVNQRLPDPRTWRRPDIRVPSERYTIDGSIGVKTVNSPQVRDFITYTQGDTVILVRPNELPTLLYRGAGQ